jgi:hypothetical protein
VYERRLLLRADAAPGRIQASPRGAWPALGIRRDELSQVRPNSRSQLAWMIVIRRVRARGGLDVHPQPLAEPLGHLRVDRQTVRSDKQSHPRRGPSSRPRADTARRSRVRSRTMWRRSSASARAAPVPASSISRLRRCSARTAPSLRADRRSPSRRRGALPMEPALRPDRRGTRIERAHAGSRHIPPPGGGQADTTRSLRRCSCRRPPQGGRRARPAARPRRRPVPRVRSSASQAEPYFAHSPVGHR